MASGETTSGEVTSGEITSGETSGGMTSGWSMYPREWVEVEDASRCPGCSFSAATYNILNSEFMR